MRHPATRFLLAAVIAALTASLLIGTVAAKGPVPEQPPGIQRDFFGDGSELYDAGTEVSVTVTNSDDSVPPKTQTWSLAAGASTAGMQAGI